MDLDNISYIDDNCKLKYINKLRTRDVLACEKLLIAKLVFSPGVYPNNQTEFPITTGLNFIGRSKDVDVCIDIPGVSSFHAFIGKCMSILILLEVSAQGHEHFIEDLDSTNGTLIGHYEHQLCSFKLYQLTHGKEISIGPVKCSYQIIDPPVASLGELPSQNKTCPDTSGKNTYASPIMIKTKNYILPSDIENSPEPLTPSPKLFPSNNNQSGNIINETFTHSNNTFAPIEAIPFSDDDNQDKESEQIDLYPDNLSQDNHRLQFIPDDFIESSIAPINEYNDESFIPQKELEISSIQMLDTDAKNHNSFDDEDTIRITEIPNTAEIQDSCFPIPPSDISLCAIPDSCAPVAEYEPSPVTEKYVKPHHFLKIRCNIDNLNEHENINMLDNASISESLNSQDQLEKTSCDSKISMTKNTKEKKPIQPKRTRKPPLSKSKNIISKDLDDAMNLNSQIESFIQEAEISIEKDLKPKRSTRKKTIQNTCVDNIEPGDTSAKIKSKNGGLSKPIELNDLVKNSVSSDDDSDLLNYDSRKYIQEIVESNKRKFDSSKQSNIAVEQEPIPVAACSTKTKKSSLPKKSGKSLSKSPPSQNVEEKINQDLIDEKSFESTHNDLGDSGLSKRKRNSVLKKDSNVEHSLQNDQIDPILETSTKKSKNSTKITKKPDIKTPDIQNSKIINSILEASPIANIELNKSSTIKRTYKKRGKAAISPIIRPDSPETKENVNEPPNVESIDLFQYENASTRNIKRRQIQKIMFTGVIVTKQQERLLKKLGGCVVENWVECTHLVTDKVRRTVKFLCALSAGKYIVDINWLEASGKAGYFIDESTHLLTDPNSEKMYNFSLHAALERTRDFKKTKVMQDVQVYITSNVKPQHDEFMEILDAAGAKLVKTLAPYMKTANNSNPVVIGCEEDSEICCEIEKQGYKVHTKEFVLTGILRQTLDYKSFLLFQ